MIKFYFHLLILTTLSQWTMNSNNLSTLRIEITNTDMRRPSAVATLMDRVYSANGLLSLKMSRQMQTMAELNSRSPMKILPFNGYDWATSSGLMPTTANFLRTALNAVNFGKFDWERSIFVGFLASLTRLISSTFDWKLTRISVFYLVFTISFAMFWFNLFM